MLPKGIILRCIRVKNGYSTQPARYMSTDPSPEDDFMKDIKNTIKDLNVVIEENPQTASGVFLTLRNLTWMSLIGIYSMPYFSFGSELAIGYLAAKVTAKFRQPANVALAAALSHQYPILSEIKVSSLLTGGVTTPTDTDKNNNNSSSGMEESIKKFMKMTSDPIDKYGFSYFLAGRINVFLTIAGTSLAIHYGMDVGEFLRSLGASETLQASAGAMGAATLTNMVLLPFHFALLINITPLTGAYMQLIQTLLRKAEERRSKHKHML